MVEEAKVLEDWDFIYRKVYMTGRLYLHVYVFGSWTQTNRQ